MHKVSVWKQITLDTQLCTSMLHTNTHLSLFWAASSYAPLRKLHWSEWNLPNWTWSEEEEWSKEEGHTGGNHEWSKEKENVKRQFDLLLCFGFWTWWCRWVNNKEMCAREEVERGGKNMKEKTRDRLYAMRRNRNLIGVQRSRCMEWEETKAESDLTPIIPWTYQYSGDLIKKRYYLFPNATTSPLFSHCNAISTSYLKKAVDLMLPCPQQITLSSDEFHLEDTFSSVEALRYESILSLFNLLNSSVVVYMSSK